MSETLEKRKRKLWRQIQQVDDPAELTRIEKSIKREKAADWREAATVLEDKTLEEIIEEQNYKPISWEEFKELADKVDIQEPLDQLLAQLSK